MWYNQGVFEERCATSIVRGTFKEQMPTKETFELDSLGVASR